MKKTLLFTAILLFTTVLLSFSQQPPGKGKFFNLTEGGVLVGNSDEVKKAPFVFHSSMNYGFYKNFSAGAGAGVEFLQETYLPVTANIMYQFRKENSVFPFIRFRAGYHIALESATAMDLYNYYPSYSSSSYYYPYYSVEKLDAKGGWMFDPSIGLVIYAKSGYGISLAAGYRYQKLKYTYEDNYILWKEYNRLILTLGITF